MLPNNPNKDINFDTADLREIYLAGGCFWGTDAFIERVLGVAETRCGYANGTTENPTYKEVCTSATGHAETVYVKYDPAKVGLSKLLDAFFETINPTSLNKQGEDVGTQYRTGIYYTDPADRETIEQFIAAKQASYSKPIVVEILPLTCFYDAEEYHQKYLEKNPDGYCHVDLGLLETLE